MLFGIFLSKVGLFTKCFINKKGGKICVYQVPISEAVQKIPKETILKERNYFFKASLRAHSEIPLL